MGKKSKELAAAQAAIFGSNVYTGPTADVEVNGHVLEVRCPRARYALEQQTPDILERLGDCVYLKATGERFFDSKETLEMLHSSSGHSGGLVATLTKKMRELINTTDEEVEKN